MCKNLLQILFSSLLISCNVHALFNNLSPMLCRAPLLASKTVLLSRSLSSSADHKAEVCRALKGFRTSRLETALENCQHDQIKLDLEDCEKILKERHTWDNASNFATVLQPAYLLSEVLLAPNIFDQHPYIFIGCNGTIGAFGGIILWGLLRLRMRDALLRKAKEHGTKLFE